MEVIIGAIIGAIATIFVAVWKIKKERTYHEKDRRTQSVKLKYHRIHEKLYTLKFSANHQIEAEDKGKELIIKNFLNNMFDIYIDIVDEIAKKIDNTKMTDNEFCNYNTEKFKEAIQKRSNYFCNKNYTDEEKESLEILLKLYEDYNARNIEQMFTDIRNISYSKYYTNNVIRQSFIFERYISEFVRIVIWASEEIDKLNGEFNGYTFKGYKIIDEGDENE